MAEEKIEFDAPPVIETVLSLQFAPLPGFTAAHVGCFWQSSLASALPEWSSAKLIELPKLQDEFEALGEEDQFRTPGFHIRPADNTSRVQIVHSEKERMIQIQDSRFVYNWRKGQGQYPSYMTIKPEFDDLFSRFQEYLAKAAFPAPQPNQWEIIYINHIPKGTLWNSVSDWAKILPGLYVPTGYPAADIQFETVAGNWRYRLSDGRGRLHVSLLHGLAQEPQKVEVILLQLTARGPIADSGLTAEAGLSLGHAAIANTFYQMTSQQAHSEWKERAR